MSQPTKAKAPKTMAKAANKQHYRADFVQLPQQQAPDLASYYGAKQYFGVTQQQFGSPTRFSQYDAAKANMIVNTPYQGAGSFFDDTALSTPLSGAAARNKQRRIDFTIPKEVLDDICARFPLSIAGEVSDDEALHLLFVVEECHWFYLDYACRDNTALRIVDFETFARQVFERYSKLSRFVRNFGALHREWLKYKRKIPVHGAILIDTNLESIVLVRQIGSRGWFFPKGKINEGESPRECAVREVLEECGFDCSELIDESEYVFIPGHNTTAGSEDDQLDGNVNRSRLFLVGGVPRDAALATRTRNEIGKIEWFRIDDLLRAAQSGEMEMEFFRVSRLLSQIAQFVVRKRAQRSVDALRSGGRSQSYAHLQPITPAQLLAAASFANANRDANKARETASRDAESKTVALDVNERSTMELYTTIYDKQNSQSTTLPSPESLQNALLRNKMASPATESTSTDGRQFSAPSWRAPRLDSKYILEAFKLAAQ